MQNCRQLISLAVVDASTLRVAAWISIGFAMLCSVMIFADIMISRRQPMAIMNFVWPLTALYAGPLALMAYFRFGRAMKHADHEMYKMKHNRPMWQSSLIGATHCGAGCMVGDVISDSTLFVLGATALLGSTLFTSYVFDFIIAYFIGIVFQYFAIVPMRHLAPAQGLWAAIKADTLSLIAFQIGMYAWMAIYQKLILGPSLQANSPVFWFMMQIGMLAGLATSVPMNWWLIRKGIKEPM